MRTLWAILLGGLAFIGTAEARLGESREQVIERYGKPIEEENIQMGGAEYKRMKCSKEGYNFTFLLIYGKVELMKVEKTELTEEVVEIFLKKNTGGAGFVETKPELLNFTDRTYVENDSGRRGVWFTLDDILVLMTKEGQKAGEEWFKGTLKKTTDGF